MTVFKGKQARKERSKLVTVPELPWKKGKDNKVMCDYEPARECAPKGCKMEDCPNSKGD